MNKEDVIFRYINGRIVPIKVNKDKTTNEYMNDKIRNKTSKKTKNQEEKEKDFNENFVIGDEEYSEKYPHMGVLGGYHEGIEKKYWNEKEKAVDYKSGEYFKQIVVNDKKTGQNVGRLWYKELYKPEMFEIPDRIQVQKIEVHPDYRRRGIATQMYKELQKRAGNEDIYFEELTGDGKKLLESVGEITKVQDMYWSYKNHKHDRYWGRIK